MKMKIFMKVFMKLCLGAILITMVLRANAVTNEALKWTDGTTYKLTPGDNMATQGNYTIKVIDLPPPVRGKLSVNDTTIPENPVIPSVKLELYKDILTNPDPIATFGLRVGEEYISKDQQIRITIDDIPGPESSDWIYESYNPWVSIRIQNVAIPNLDIQINFKDSNGNDIDSIDPGKIFLADIKITNSGTDAGYELNFNINPDQLKVFSKSTPLKDSIPKLDISGEKDYELTLVAPIAVESMLYSLYVNVTGRDIENINYYWNYSNNIIVNSSLSTIILNKAASKSTVYLKESNHISLNIINNGPIGINNLVIEDRIVYNEDRNKLKLVRDNIQYNLTDLSQLTYTKESLAPGESWITEYYLKPIVPGIYMLPTFTINYTMEGERYSLASNEQGFRVYGPIIVLNKTIIDKGKNVVEVDVNSTNIGNGFTTVIIDDNLPDHSTIVSGSNHTSISLDNGENKVMRYEISFDGGLGLKNINLIKWPPANAIYFLDDYKFNTSSDQKPPEIIEATPTPTNTPVVTVPVPTTTESERQVVATIHIKTEKKTPGFELVDMVGMILIFGILIIMKQKIKKVK